MDRSVERAAAVRAEVPEAVAPELVQAEAAGQAEAEGQAEAAARAADPFYQRPV